jgi:hypothetical protein
MNEEILNEDRQIHVNADHRDPAAGRRRSASGRLCREHGMSDASFDKWRAKYGGMDASLTSQMKAIEDENRRLTLPALTSARAHVVSEVSFVPLRSRQPSFP